MAAVEKNERAIPALAPSTNLAVVLTIAAMIVGFAAMLPLVQSSGATSRAGEIQQLETEKGGMQARIRELELEVAGLGSLARIENEARTRLQMEAPKDTHYIAVDAPPPEQDKLPSRYVPAEHPVEPEGSSLADDLFGWLVP
jgi:cell division protein FtsL